MTHEDLLQEASDPSTDSERLRELARHEDDVVMKAAWMNPSLPEDAWRAGFLDGYPEAWANPMAPIYLLTWTPREDDDSFLEDATRWATGFLWETPSRCSIEGKTLIATKFTEWWSEMEFDLPEFSLSLLTFFAKDNDEGEDGFCRILRLTAERLKKIENLTGKDIRALEIFEDWCLDHVDSFGPNKLMIDSEVIKNFFELHKDFHFDFWLSLVMAEKFARSGQEHGKEEAIEFSKQDDTDKQSLLDVSHKMSSFWNHATQQAWQYVDLENLSDDWGVLETSYTRAYEAAAKKTCSLLAEAYCEDDDEEDDVEDDEWAFLDDPVRADHAIEMWRHSDREGGFDGLELVRVWYLNHRITWVEAYDKRRGKSWYVSPDSMHADWKQGQPKDPPLPDLAQTSTRRIRTFLGSCTATSTTPPTRSGPW
jgi:hypothetical protein